MTITVNGQEADRGCYVAGHWGQYGLDRLGDVAEQFDIELNDDDDPRHWRRLHEEAVSQQQAEGAWERLVWAADKIEELLNDRTEGGYWTWEGGEFFLTYAGPVLCDKCGRIGNEDDLAFDDEECPDEDCDGICHAYEQEGTT